MLVAVEAFKVLMRLSFLIVFIVFPSLCPLSRLRTYLLQKTSSEPKLPFGQKVVRELPYPGGVGRLTARPTFWPWDRLSILRFFTIDLSEYAREFGVEIF